MLKQTIKYVDFNDEEQIANEYFNLTKREIMKIGLNKDDGIMKDLIDASEEFKDIEDFENLENSEKDELIKKVIMIIDALVEVSYGVKSEDGSKFVKNKEITDEFMSSPVYDAMFDDMVSNMSKFVEFISGLLPESKELKNLLDKNA